MRDDEADDEATRFAAELYRRLTLHEPLAEAVARARLELWNPRTPADKPSAEWHLARLVLARDGGGVLAAGNRTRARAGPAAQKIFLDARRERVPVAGPREFVGRRRELQTVLGAFRQADGERPSGVLVHGMGRQGKSSLAARVAQRVEASHTLAVLHGSYDAVAFVQAVEEAVGADAREWTRRHAAVVQEDPAALYGALLELPGERPLLLVIDDFEQALEPRPEGLPQVKKELVEPVRAVLLAFRRGAGGSRLILTSRWRFALSDARGHDLTADLLDLPLPPMREVEGRKQVRAKLRQRRDGEPAPDRRRIERIVEVARGNPGLQDLLFSLQLQDPAACGDALDEMEAFLREGREPSREEVLEFLANLAVDRLLDVLSSNERELLRASTLFDVPVPSGVMGDFARDLGLAGGKEEVGERLFALGLWEGHGPPDGEQTVAINALVRPRAGPLGDEERAGLIAKVPFLAGWGGADRAVSWFEDRFLYRFAAELGLAAVRVLDQRGGDVPARLLRKAGEVCVRTGDTKAARDFYSRARAQLASAVEQGEEVDAEEYAATLVSHARLLGQDGAIDEALEGFEEAQQWLKDDAFRRERAVTLGEIARIRVSRGEVDEALSLHEEMLTVFEELGDLDGKANALWSLAQIHLRKNDHQAAYDQLSESYAINVKLRRLDGICFVGLDLGQLLCATGHLDEGRTILVRSRDGFQHLGWTNRVRQVEAILDQLPSESDEGS